MFAQFRLAETDNVHKYDTYLKSLSNNTSVSHYAPWDVRVDNNVLTGVLAPLYIDGFEEQLKQRTLFLRAHGNTMPLLFESQTRVINAPKIRLIIHPLSDDQTVATADAHLFVLYSLTIIGNGLFPMCFTMGRFRWNELVTFNIWKILGKYDMSNDPTYACLYNFREKFDMTRIDAKTTQFVAAIMQEPHFGNIDVLLEHLERIRKHEAYTSEGDPLKPFLSQKAIQNRRALNKVSVRTWIAQIMGGLLHAQRSYAYQLRNISHKTLGFCYTDKFDLCERKYVLICQPDMLVQLKVPKDRFDAKRSGRTDPTKIPDEQFHNHDISVIYPAGVPGSGDKLDPINCSRNYQPMFYDLQYATCHALVRGIPNEPLLRVNDDAPNQKVSKWLSGFYPAPELLFWPRDTWFMRRTVESDNFSLGFTLWYLFAATAGNSSETLTRYFDEDYKQCETMLKSIGADIPSSRYDPSLNGAFGHRDVDETHGPFLRMCKLMVAIHGDTAFFPHNSILPNESYGTSPLVALFTKNAEKGKDALRDICTSVKKNKYINMMTAIVDYHGIEVRRFLIRLTHWYPSERINGGIIRPVPVPVPAAIPAVVAIPFAPARRVVRAHVPRTEVSQVKHTLARIMDEEAYFRPMGKAWRNHTLDEQKQIYQKEQVYLRSIGHWISVTTDPLDSRVNPADKRARSRRTAMSINVEKVIQEMISTHVSIKPLATAIRDSYKISISESFNLPIGQPNIIGESIDDEPSEMDIEEPANDPIIDDAIEEEEEEEEPVDEEEEEEKPVDEEEEEESQESANEQIDNDVDFDE